MRRALTVFLLLLLGVSFVTGGEAYRFCLIDGSVLYHAKTHGEAGDCCEQCPLQNDPCGSADDCCLHVDKFPPSTQPSAPEKVPDVALVEDFLTMLALALLPGAADLADDPPAPVLVTPLPPPVAERAVLGVWTI